MSPPSPPDSAPPADGPDWTGRIIAGRYRVEDVLGAGGMGTAYRARDDRTGRVVVLKVPHSKHFSEQESRERFLDEVRKLLEIEHLHVVKVFDVGEEDGKPFAVFQHLGGGSLKARLRAAGGRMSPEEVVPWLRQVADALDDLHARGDIHRDVKPDNILFDRPTAKGKCNAYLGDFGLAKALGVDPARIFHSRTGTMIGTQAYMAPEQFDRRGTVTGAVDQYALATSVYQALAGEMPYAVSSAEELVFEKLRHAPRPLSEFVASLPPGLEDVVMRGLATAAEDRFADCTAFADAFAAAVAGGARPEPVRPIREEESYEVPASRAELPWPLPADFEPVPAPTAEPEPEPEPVAAGTGGDDAGPDETRVLLGGALPSPSPGVASEVEVAADVAALEPPVDEGGEEPAAEGSEAPFEPPRDPEPVRRRPVRRSVRPVRFERRVPWSVALLVLAVAVGLAFLLAAAL